MRHGESSANKRGILISNPRVGVKKYGLTETGKRHVKSNVKAFKALDEKTIIYSSDFLRAVETANIVKEVLHASQIIVEPKLRERFFGKFEKTPAANYHLVWVEDNINPAQKRNGVESVIEVQSRMTKLICLLEKKYCRRKILLISHGDPLQILEASFLRKKKMNHLLVPMPNKAEIREMRLLK